MRIFHNPNYNFVKWRYHALVASFVIIAAGVFTIISRGGVPLGVDFSGGTVMIVTFDRPVGEDAVRNALPFAKDAVVQTYGDPSQNRVMIRLPMMTEAEEGANLEAEAVKVETALRAANLVVKDKSTDLVGPVMGKDLRSKGIYATLASLGGILIYIWFRFRFTFAVGAVIATFHDVLITMAFLVWFGYDLSLNIVAALLTITGYSVNDTIVIFDRVRENQRTSKREPLADVVNRSVNQTLSRTVITAGMTFIAVVALYLFGGEVLRGLAFTLLVGIIFGTYSSVFVASAIAIILSPKPTADQTAAAAAAARTRRG
jgi:preprotein translocase subunit SecF